MREARTPWSAARRRFIQSRTGLAGALVLVIVTLAALFAAQVAPYNPTRQDFRVEHEPPSAQHLMGTDEFGRDVLSRIIWGAQASLQAGATAASIALIARCRPSGQRNREHEEAGHSSWHRQDQPRPRRCGQDVAWPVHPLDGPPDRSPINSSAR